MSSLDNKNLDEILVAVRKAGVEIMNIYTSDSFEIETKEDDSPLTRADKAAHNVLVETLLKTGIPILSEEGEEIPYFKRKNWDQYWLVDPLDGTKEFIKKNGEFTVNVALIEKKRPVFGVVYAPVLDKMYFGGTLLGCSKLKINNVVSTLEKRPLKRLDDFNRKEPLRIVASRTHHNQATTDFLETFEKAEIRSMGSSLKFMLLAENEADVYPRFAPTMEWDTGAADAILRPLGKYIYKVSAANIVSNVLLQYNKENLINPSFISN